MKSDLFIQNQFIYFCRCCGRLFCSECSEQSVPIPAEQLYSPVRVCNSCYNQLTTSSCDHNIAHDLYIEKHDYSSCRPAVSGPHEYNSCGTTHNQLTLELHDQVCSKQSTENHPSLSDLVENCSSTKKPKGYFFGI